MGTAASLPQPEAPPSLDEGAPTPPTASQSVEAADADAARLFDRFRLRGEQLDALNEERRRADPLAPALAEADAVMRTAELRAALAEAGDAVDGAPLFELVQLADPEAEGVTRLPQFAAVIRRRREQRAKEAQLAQLTAAYLALGGTADREAAVSSAKLLAITSDFVGRAAVEHSLEAVVKHKMKSVQEILDMGGVLDEEERREIEDTTKLTFDELEVFSRALYDAGNLFSSSTDDEDATP
ncbi:hypothetical protein AB1Y20_010696 [Prymnesium parvum]|uniref:Uncharacterized protein n=1 Tax=Prymnesium parvum TaxID=97485 RepID=A0AB34IRS0_PRYPA